MGKKEYERRLGEFTRLLRVNPEDEVTRLVLADFMEDHDPASDIRASTRVLRCGLVLITSLDRAALANVEARSSIREIGPFDAPYFTGLRLLLRASNGMRPGDCINLWVLAQRYQPVGLDNDMEVAMEADRVTQERKRLRLTINLVKMN